MTFGVNQFNCECGGLRHICAKHGHLPDSRAHYTRPAPSPHYEVVWSGRGELLDDRSERVDARLASMPTYDLDDGESADVAPKRKYTLTGNHVGKFSRTNPDAPQYIPTTVKSATVPKEETTHG